VRIAQDQVQGDATPLAIGANQGQADHAFGTTADWLKVCPSALHFDPATIWSEQLRYSV